MMKARIERIAGKLGFSVNWTQTKHGKYAEFSKRSPAGQDFSFDCEYKTLGEIPEKVYEYYKGYDPSNEASLWLDGSGHGRNGAPYEMGDIFEDMKWCKESVRGLYEALSA